MSFKSLVPDLLVRYARQIAGDEATGIEEGVDNEEGPAGILSMVVLVRSRVTPGERPRNFLPRTTLGCPLAKRYASTRGEWQL